MYIVALEGLGYSNRAVGLPRQFASVKGIIVRDTHNRDGYGRIHQNT